jgi:hypothetical protein
MEKGEDCIPTREINQHSRPNVTVGTMRTLENKGLVEYCKTYRFNKPFRVKKDGELEAIEDYSLISDLKKRGEKIVWIPWSKSYSWKLTKEGYGVSKKLEDEI